ncbi:MAG: hypothetical protein O7J95_16740, partial [Planctomycetota bacterium]|nr:hypothetical protein [Planctomycetota bacterium]
MTSEERQKRLDPRQIRDVLRSLRGRVRLHVGLRGAALLVGTLALVALASLAIDRGFRLSVGARSVALFVYGFAMLWVSWRYLLRPLLVGLPDRLLADSLERHFPALGDTLRSAIDFLRTPGIFDRAAPRRLPEEQALTLLLKQEVTHQAASRLGSTETREIVASGRSLASVAVWVLPAVLAVGLGLAFTEVSSLWFRRNLLLSDVEWPYRTILHVEGFTDRRLGVPRGDPLRVRVRVEGEEPDLVSIRLDFEGDRARYNLARTREGFEYRHSAVTEDFRFVVEGGDYRSKPYEVFVQERPRVEAITVTLTPPAYTGRGPIRGEGGLGEMAAPQGSRLSLEGHANKDLESASLWTENRQVPLEVSADRRQFSGAYLPETGGGVTVHLEDVEGIDPDQRLQFSLHLIPDRTPAVQLKVSGLGPMITPVALMPLEIHAKDD